MRDLISNILLEQLLAPQGATTTQTSESTDLQGSNSVAIAFSIGNTGDTLSESVKWEMTVEHSDDNSSFDPIGGGDILASSSGEYPVVVDSNDKTEAVYVIGYKGAKRYVRGVITATGSHSSGTVVSVIAIKGNLALAPSFLTAE